MPQNILSLSNVCVLGSIVLSSAVMGLGVVWGINEPKFQKHIIPLLLLSSNIHYLWQSSPAYIIGIFSWAALIAFMINGIVKMVKNYDEIIESSKNIKPHLLGESVKFIFLGNNLENISKIISVIYFEFEMNCFMLGLEKSIFTFILTTGVSIYCACFAHLATTFVLQKLQFKYAQDTPILKEMFKVVFVVSTAMHEERVYSPDINFLKAHSTEIENLSIIFVIGSIGIGSYGLLNALHHKLYDTLLEFDLGKVLFSATLGLSVGFFSFPLVKKMVDYCLSLEGPERI